MKSPTLNERISRACAYLDIPREQQLGLREKKSPLARFLKFLRNAFGV